MLGARGIIFLTRRPYKEQYNAKYKLNNIDLLDADVHRHGIAMVTNFSSHWFGNWASWDAR